MVDSPSCFIIRLLIQNKNISNSPCSLFPVQLHVTVSKTSVKVVLDCSFVGEKSISASGNITTDGVEVLGRMFRSRGPQDSSAPVSMNSCPYHMFMVPSGLFEMCFPGIKYRAINRTVEYGRVRKSSSYSKMSRFIPHPNLHIH